MRDKHGPNKLSNYRDLHSTWMHRFQVSGFVVDDAVEFQPFGEGFLLVAGRITCAGSIYVDVWKVLRVEGKGASAFVRTISYSYNAALPGRGNILRYDSPHQHRPYHHVHRFRVFDGDREGTIQQGNETDWPTLGEVLQELSDWFYANERLLTP